MSILLTYAYLHSSSCVFYEMGVMNTYAISKCDGGYATCESLLLELIQLSVSDGWHEVVV